LRILTPRPDRPRCPAPKLNKPPIFTGKDLSLATINVWVYKIRSYVRRLETDDEKVEVAVLFLSDTAELCFISLYGTAPEQPTFEAFITAFKERFSHTNDARQPPPPS
jgi:hypothetical protein